MAARRVFTLPGAARAFSVFDRPLQDAIVVGGNEGLAVMLRLITTSPVMRRMSTARNDSGGYIQAANPPPGPLGIRTGELAESVSFEPFYRKGNEFRGGHFTVGVKYGMIQERGGVIQHPGSTKFQRFTWKGQDVAVRFTRPHAIRIPARPFIRPGAERGLPTMVRIIDRRITLVAEAELGL